MGPSLLDLEVLALDCQATGAGPARGALIEIGWARVRARDPEGSRAVARLVRPPSGAVVPRQVQRITGISDEDLRHAAPPESAWRALVAEAGSGEGGGAPPMPAVVHFARFEEPFLRALHLEWSGGEPFPLELLCTHELARHLLPTLPRKGLRAVAGYFGREVGELRRCEHHVAATALVWGELVRLLREREGITDLGALRRWLVLRPRPAARPGRYAYPMDPGLRRAVPDRPGVYRMRRTGGGVLYVGKARSLRRRVNSYFQKHDHPERTLEMLAQARQVDYTLTETGLEAALLEAEEIRRLAPPYNVALRERGRRLAFCSTDLRSVAARPDSRHVLGPFASPDAMTALGALARLLGRDAGDPPDEALLRDLLAVPAERAPTIDALAEALRLFRTRHRLLAEEDPVPRLLWLGARLWRARPPAEEPVEASWTPETLADAFGEVVREGSRRVRRARWLVRLAECALAWSEGGSRTLLVFSAGAVVARGRHGTGQAVPPPPGHARPRDARQRGLDRPAYERLGILSRELKALVARAPDVELRLSPTRALRGAALAAALSWV